MMPFKNYGIKDGLGSNNVQAVIRDDRGLLWVGTDFGVSWFDGKRFYQPEIKTNIGQLYVKGFYQDRNRTIWILTFFNGIYKYQNGRFSNYLVDTLLKDAITNSVTDMVQVSATQYVVINQNAAYLFDGKKFSVFDPDNPILKTKANAVTLLPGGTIAFSTGDGAFLYSYTNGRFINTAHPLTGKPVNKILVEGNLLWALINNTLYLFKPPGAAPFADQPMHYLGKTPLKDITADKSGSLWVIADNGSFWSQADTVYKIKGGAITQYTPRDGLPGNIQQIYCDNEGLVWFPNRKGITMLGDEYYEFSTTANNGYNNPVASLLIDSKHRLWSGTVDGLMLKKDEKYEFYQPGSKQTFGYVSWMTNNKDGSFLTGGANGVFKIGPKSVKKYLDINSTAFFADDFGNEWHGGITGQVWKFDGRTLTQFTAGHPVTEMITALAYADDRLWVGYRDKGLIVYKIAGNSLVKIKEFGAGNGYPDMRMRCGLADKKGNLIWGTRTNGVFVFSAKTAALVAHITTQNGLSANWTKSLYYNTDGSLYLSTNNGVNIITGDYKNPRIKQLKIDDDNIDRETNCVIKDGGIFYVGTNEGILKWKPGNIRKDTVAPPVYFTQINIQRQKKFAVAPYTADGGKITLPYDQHFISFEFAGVSLKNPDLVRYHYQLSGQDNEWGPLTGHNDVAYNLKPGSYTFKVEAESGDGIWSRRPAVFHFIIRPPFWQTWWFIILIAAAIFFSAYGAYRYKLSKILALELLRNKISSDLHDDIGSTLSSISILSDIAVREKEQKSKKILGEISERSHQLMEKMDDIVWSISSKNDSVGNLFIRIQQFASSVLEAKDIDYEVLVPEKVKDMKLDMQKRQHIYLVLKEAINNLMKYSGCSHVSIHAEHTGGWLKITVTDNGRGFDKEKIRLGNGLNNMQKRTDLMRGKLEIKTMPGSGTSIMLSVQIE